jgi:hypothetical protein
MPCAPLTGLDREHQLERSSPCRCHFGEKAVTVRMQHAFSRDCWINGGSQTTPYLTDGTKLYRYVGAAVSNTAEQLIALEDCQSLKILDFDLDEPRSEAATSGRPGLDRVGNAPSAPAGVKLAASLCILAR